MTRTVAVTGGFDPLHRGHVMHMMLARQLGDRLVVILQSDANLIAKKGYAFMPYEDRELLISHLRFVDDVVRNIDPDGTSAVTLRQLRPHILAKGGDRIPGNMPANEVEACREIGCRIVYGVGGQLESSQDLVRRAAEYYCREAPRITRSGTE